jgi:toxin ParE1/3/4
LTHFEELLTADAAADLAQIHDHVSARDAPSKAEDVLERIEKVLQTLARVPRRGACPKELLAVGVREYRQMHFEPCRVIYRIIGERVHVYLIVDGRRDMPALLQRWLLAA